MVEVIKADRGPLIEIHHIKRDVFGNGIAVKIYGEIKMAAKEVVYARELGLNTLQVMVLTSEAGDHHPYVPVKWIYHKGEYDNYASIDIFSMDAYQYEAGVRSGSISAPATLPYDGSIWLDFIALGE